MRTLFLVSHVLAVTLLYASLAQGLNPKCETADHGSTLQVFHVYSPCSPFKPSKPLSWDESVLQMQVKDQARLQYLTSLVARKSVVPIASGRQIIQSPTYIVRAKIGTPAQTFLLAMDTSNDAAWIPCSGCVGCPSTTLFASDKSTTFKTLGCEVAQCKQVRDVLLYYIISVNSWLNLWKIIKYLDYSYSALITRCMGLKMTI